MPSYKVKGLDKYLAKLSRLQQEDAEKFLGEAIYDGAKVIADATKSALASLPVDNRRYVKHRVSITQGQKEGLIKSYGIAPMRYDGDYLNVKVGFDGYNDVITKRWPQGQPNVVIARALESGTSFMSKNPIISKTQTANKEKCIDTISKSIAKKIDDLFEKE